MSINVTATEIFGAEHILREVMHIVVSHLGMQDLSNLSEVCTSWREEALREKTKRFYIQQLSLPCKFSNRDIITTGLNPHVSLIFYKRKRDDLSMEDVANEKLLEDSLKQLPQRTLAIGVNYDYLSTDDTELNLESNCCILNFLFPRMKQGAHVRLVCAPPSSSPVPTNYDEYLSNKIIHEAVINDVADRLGLNDCEYRKSTYILCFVSQNSHAFIPGGGSIVASLIKRIQDKGDQFMVYALSKIMSVNCQNENNGADRICMMALSIASPNVESWTTTFHNSSLIDDIKLKLQALKKRVKPSRYCTGLFHGFNCDELSCNHINHPARDKQKLMCILKSFFPGVPFMGTFGPWFKYDLMDKCNENFETRLLRDVSIMIISYD